MSIILPVSRIISGTLGRFDRKDKSFGDTNMIYL